MDDNGLGFLLILGGILLVSWIASRMEDAQLERAREESKEELCPPHSWQTFDQPGMPGVVYMRCTKCHLMPQEVR